MKKIIFFLYLFQAVFMTAQQTKFIDFKSVKAEINISSIDKSVTGKATYYFDVLKDVDSVYLDAKNFTHIAAVIDGKGGGGNVEGDKHHLVLKEDLNANTSHELLVTWVTFPKKAIYFLKRNGHPQIWTQGQGKYTSNWLPSLDDTNDKIEFDLSITYDRDYQVISNGKLTHKQVNDSTITWHYIMQKSMPSYLVGLAIGEYNKITKTSKSGIPLEYYYYPEDSLKVEPTYRYSKQMFDFLEEEIGFPYPWQNYKQVPVHDFLYAGMENTSCTIFSDDFVVDDIAFNDKNYVNVNAHELAHQWFGNLVTATSGEHHWLQEGFATYYALLAERDIFGDKHFFYELYKTAVDLGQQDLSGKGTSLLNPKSSSLTFYQRGAWVLFALRSKVGDMAYKTAVKRYLNKHQFGNVQTSDFITEVEEAYGKPLTEFVNTWIKQIEFPLDEAYQLLKEQSPFINEYLMIDCEVKTSKCSEYLRYYASDEAKIKVISQVPELVSKDTFKHGLKVRQAISQYVTKIPEDLKENYESLLNDASYVTIENALYNLWINFPEERAKYLTKTKDIEGFSDKNVRLLWIVLHLNTPYYQVDQKQKLYDELVDYTNNMHAANLRMNAFRYLNAIKGCDTRCQKNLENAKTHHNWRMVKFAKEWSKKIETKE